VVHKRIDLQFLQIHPNLAKKALIRRIMCVSTSVLSIYSSAEIVERHQQFDP